MPRKGGEHHHSGSRIWRNPWGERFAHRTLSQALYHVVFCSLVGNAPTARIVAAEDPLLFESEGAALADLEVVDLLHHLAP